MRPGKPTRRLPPPLYFWMIWTTGDGVRGLYPFLYPCLYLFLDQDFVLISGVDASRGVDRQRRLRRHALWQAFQNSICVRVYALVSAGIAV